jgi:hypothetical protein
LNVLGVGWINGGCRRHAREGTGSQHSRFGSEGGLRVRSVQVSRLPFPAVRLRTELDALKFL